MGKSYSSNSTAHTHVRIRARGASKGHTESVCSALRNASRSVRALNPSVFGGEVPGTAAADVEPHPVNEAAGAHGRKGAYSRCRITVRSFRARLADPDGICVKHAIDGLVLAGVIPDDNATVVRAVTVEQVKVAHLDEERTEIVVEEA